MSGSFLDSQPSQSAGHYRSDLFDSCSPDSFSSDSFGSESYEQIHRVAKDEKLILPPKLTSIIHKQNHQLRIPTKGKAVKRYTSTNTKGKHSTFIDESNAENISVWEQWLIHKLQTEREKNKIKKAEEKLKEQQQKEEEMKKQLRIEMAEDRHKQWVEEKLLKLHLKNSSERRQKKISGELEESKKKRIEEESRERYKQWKLKHDQDEKKKREKEKQEKENEERIKEEKKQINEEHFQSWLEKNKQRFSKMQRPNSATPSYVNPTPWQPCLQAEPQKAPTVRERTENRPTRHSRKPETHSPMRLGGPRVPLRGTQSGLVRTCTPLRFAGVRSKVNHSNAAKTRPRTAATGCTSRKQNTYARN